MQPSRERDTLYEALGYRFKDETLLSLALTHCSFNGQQGRNNQRLEFLGDAVINFVVSERLYRDMGADEGRLTRMRASVVRESALAKAAKKLDLGSLILLGKGEDSTGGRDKQSILCDMMEAVIGAVYLDGGLDAAGICVLALMDDALGHAMRDGGGQDHKTMLQQLCASLQLSPPRYETTGSQGPPHAPMFTIGVYVSDSLLAQASGRTKKEAEQDAALNALTLLNAGVRPR
jgi:ribonuclease-3